MRWSAGRGRGRRAGQDLIFVRAASLPEADIRAASLPLLPPAPW